MENHTLFNEAKIKKIGLETVEFNDVATYGSMILEDLSSRDRFDDVIAINMVRETDLSQNAKIYLAYKIGFLLGRLT